MNPLTIKINLRLLFRNGTVDYVARNFLIKIPIIGYCDRMVHYKAFAYFKHLTHMQHTIICSR